MNKQILTILLSFVTATSFCDDVTFESLQNEFHEKVLSLLDDKSAASIDEIQPKINAFASDTFGAHPEIMRKETIRRLKELKPFPEAELKEYVEFETITDIFKLPPAYKTVETWLLLRSSPEDLGEWMKSYILGKTLKPAEFSRRNILMGYRPDQVYQHGDGEFPDIIVDSLGDLFVIEIEMTDYGVFKPTSVSWLKKKSPNQGMDPTRENAQSIVPNN